MTNACAKEELLTEKIHFVAVDLHMAINQYKIVSLDAVFEVTTRKSVRLFSCNHFIGFHVCTSTILEKHFKSYKSDNFPHFLQFAS